MVERPSRSVLISCKLPLEGAAFDSVMAQAMLTAVKSAAGAFVTGAAKVAVYAAVVWDGLVDEMPDVPPQSRQWTDQTGSLLNTTPGPGPGAGVPWVP